MSNSKATSLPWLSARRITRGPVGRSEMSTRSSVPPSLSSRSMMTPWLRLTSPSAMERPCRAPDRSGRSGRPGTRVGTTASQQAHCPPPPRMHRWPRRPPRRVPTQASRELRQTGRSHLARRAANRSPEADRNRGKPSGKVEARGGLRCLPLRVVQVGADGVWVLPETRGAESV